MKQDNHQHPVSGNGSSLEPFYFEFSHPTARAVRIAGTFNDWRPEAEPMHFLGEGYWLKKATLPPGIYEYCFIVDGQWMPDPLARESVPNPFGGRNSILTVAGSPEAAHLATAEFLSLENTNKQKAWNL